MLSSLILGGFQGITLPTLKTFTGSSDLFTSISLSLALILLVWPVLFRKTRARRKAKQLSPVFYPNYRLDMNGNLIV